MPPESKELNFIINVEEDEVKAGELGHTDAGDLQFDVGFTDDESEDSLTPKDHVFAEIEASNSYFSAEFSTIQPLDEQRSILILRVRCHPAIGRRFVNATITWKVAALKHRHDLQDGRTQEPRVIHLAPELSVGGWTEERTNLVWGVALPVEVGFMGSSIGIQASRNQESQRAVAHAMIIAGTKRNLGSYCVWTVEENKISARGIPSHFQLAIVVEHQGPFETELDLKAEIGGGFWRKYVKAKKGNGVRSLTRTIDIEKWKHGEVPWEPGEKGWKKFLQGVTGEVTGIMQDFSQNIVRP